MPELLGFVVEKGQTLAQVSFPDAKLHRYDVATNKFVAEPNPHIENLPDSAIKTKLKMCENMGTGIGAEFWAGVLERFNAFDMKRPKIQASKENVTDVVAKPAIFTP